MVSHISSCYATFMRHPYNPLPTLVNTSSSIVFLFMSFPQRLAALRKERGFTQQQMADKIGMHVSQLKRYESGASQPTIEVFRRIVLALNVSADMLLFEEGERGPDERLKLQFEAVSHLDEHEREAVQTMIAGVLHMHDAKRWQQSASASSAAAATPPTKAKAGKPKPVSRRSTQAAHR
jgi:transcriptional regulator with XRE-family HTH domain